MERSQARVAGLSAVMVLIVSMLIYLAVAGRPGLVAPSATGVTPTCGQVLSGGDFFLKAGLSSCATNPALTLDSARLDMRGHTIAGNDALSGDGVRLVGAGSVLENGIVRDASAGVSLQGSGPHVVRKVVSKSNFFGFDIDVAGNIIRNSAAVENQSDGFLIGAGDQLIVGNRAIRNSHWGFAIPDGSDANTLWDNVASANAIGYRVEPLSTGNHFVRNSAVANPDGGWFVEGDDNELLLNLAKRNAKVQRSGFLIAGDDNTLGSNRAIENRSFGVNVIGLNNDLVANRGRDNKGFDLRDSTACALNRWEGNKGTAEQSCIKTANEIGPSAQPVTQDCGDTLPPGDYFLTDNFGPCTTTNSLILDSARLDLRGFSILGDGVTGDIDMIGTGSLLENGTVRDLGNGVQLSGTGSHIVRNVDAASNTFSGFAIDTPNNILRGNTAMENGQDGFQVSNVSGNLLTGNTASHSVFRGFAPGGTSGTVLWNNVSTANADGFDLSSTATGDVVVANRATKNTVNGFEVNGGANTFLLNNAVKNGREFQDPAFRVDGNGNLVGSTKLIENGGNGIEVSGTGTDLVANRGRDNGGIDFVDTVDECLSNQWEGNKGTRDPACIG